ncbi:KRI1-like family-domain-containing protein [Aspergillus varians]
MNKTMEPPAKKSRKFLDDESSSDSGDESGGVALGGLSTGAAFKINEDYARRFEHNKRREEMLQLEAKLGKSEDEEESSEDEDEDDDAELATEAVDAEIMETIKAIRSKDPRLYDQNVTFFNALDENAGPQKREDKEKPMTLRDYHRENLLSGTILTDEAPDAPKTYAQEQDDLKSAIVKEMHAAGDEDSGSDDEDENDEFLVRKSAPEPTSGRQKAPQIDVENADKDPETFLSNFMSSRAWLQTGKSQLQPFESDDEEEDERAEAWEEAYNFRFEDPSKLNNKLITHARDTINKQSVRREEVSGRKKVRESARSKKEEEKKQRETEKNRLRKLKMEQLQEKVEKIKEAAGIRASELTDEEWARFLDASWDDKDWEEEMQKRFNDNYYAEDEAVGSGGETGGKKKKPKKPTWDDDIDINDLVPDFENDEQPKAALSDIEMDDSDEGGNKKSKAQERREQKREARKDKLRIEEAVDRNLDLDLTLLPGSTKRNNTGFRYRETSPQSFGLSALDVLMADDVHLNQFAGLKKYAAFREDEQKKRDQKRLGKKARLRQWRKDTFGSEEGPKEFVFGNEKPPAADQEDDATEKVDIREGEPRKKKRKRSKKH